jgi:dTMP kinase
MTFIVFEGIEGAGKSTQVRLLAQWLEAAARPVVTVREPGGTPLGDEIRRLLLDPGTDIVPPAEALLFMASRGQLLERVVRPALDRGAVVLMDRFFLSTYAYQVSGRGLPPADVEAANRLAVGPLRPDVTVLLRLPVEAGLARAAGRGGPDRMERAERSFHERVADAFERFATPGWQGEHPEAGVIEAVDASGTEDAVFQRVQGVLRSRLPDTFAELQRR